MTLRAGFNGAEVICGLLCVGLCQCFSVCCFNETYSQFLGKHIHCVKLLHCWQLQISSNWTLSCMDCCTARVWERTWEGLCQCTVCRFPVLITTMNDNAHVQKLHPAPYSVLSVYYNNSFRHNLQWPMWLFSEALLLSLDVHLVIFNFLFQMNSPR